MSHFPGRALPLLCVVACSVLVACKADILSLAPVSTKIPEYQGYDYYPLFPNAQWDYTETEDNRPPVHWTETMTSVGKVGEDLVGVMATEEPGSTQTVRQGAGFIREDFSDAAATASMCVLKYPLTIGDTWTVVGPYTAKVLSREAVEVPAGRFEDTFKISEAYPYSYYYSWYARGVGLVKKELHYVVPGGAELLQVIVLDKFSH